MRLFLGGLCILCVAAVLLLAPCPARGDGFRRTGPQWGEPVAVAYYHPRALTWRRFVPRFWWISQP